MQPDHVLVRLRCNVRHQEMSFCVRMNRGVPDTLRCTPTAAVGAVAPPRSVASVRPYCREIGWHVGSMNSSAAVGLTT